MFYWLNAISKYPQNNRNPEPDVMASYDKPNSIIIFINYRGTKLVPKTNTFNVLRFKI